MSDWRPLPSYALDAAPDVGVWALDRVRSLAALRTLIALHCIGGLSLLPDSNAVAVASIGDIAGFSGLAKSSVQKGLAELIGSGVIHASGWNPDTPWAPRAFTILPRLRLEDNER